LDDGQRGSGDLLVGSSFASGSGEDTSEIRLFRREIIALQTRGNKSIRASQCSLDARFAAHGFTVFPVTRQGLETFGALRMSRDRPGCPHFPHFSIPESILAEAMHRLW